MSIVPSDSASQQGVSESAHSSLVLCEAPVYPSPDLLSAMGPARYSELLSVYEKQMRSYYAAYQSYCRVFATTGSAVGSSLSAGAASACSEGAVSVGSTSSARSSESLAASSVQSVPSAIRGMSKSAVRRLSRTMRQRGVTSALPGGYCYARLVRPEARESVAMALGSYPAFGDLLARPREEFLPLSATSDVSISLGSTGVAHIDYHSKPGVDVRGGTYNASVSRLASCSEFSFGSYGHMVRSAGLAFGSSQSEGLVNLDTPVGGFGQGVKADVDAALVVSTDLMSVSSVSAVDYAVSGGERTLAVSHGSVELIFIVGPKGNEIQGFLPLPSGSSGAQVQRAISDRMLPSKVVRLFTIPGLTGNSLRAGVGRRVRTWNPFAAFSSAFSLGSRSSLEYDEYLTSQEFSV